MRAVAYAFRAIGSCVTEIVSVNDVLIVAGLLAFGWGAWVVAPPLAAMAVGAFVAWVGIQGARRESHRRKRGY